MDAGNQRILGYFIEEAKEHLDTIEKGLLNLPAVVKDPDTVNEMFRAAHSVKGGAAMLGYGSIQKTAHRLEDGFKILKEHDLKVDSNLETLFFQSFDILKDLIEQLQGPFGLREDEAQKAVQAAEPNFMRLQNYLERLTTGGAGAAAMEAPAEATSVTSKSPPDFAIQVTGILKQMLQLFKQQDTPTSRQQIQEYCKHLAKMGGGGASWQELLKTCFHAIANTKNSYQTLAPLVIKEVKQASDFVQQGKGNGIAPSPELQKLAIATPPQPPAQPPSKPATETPVKPPSKPPVKPPSETPVKASTSPAPDTPAKQITIPIEAKGAAKAIIKAFNKKQIVQLVKLLHAHAKNN
ncbi:MAG TPA: histidine kinase [Cyanobacteria bacterium UBA11149]|nr:histidine kinase [Cyanobacteria bacterium UBA11367]HBE61026.1 histidine kinase [Cyanobacteria bacterium UBA11366]HBK65754.1 histidine kinase [Cyanobacteria bacterium UBA11166]HBR72683.1 histidine kinase [Cyanobacteria bacterium UBA11159]HBS69960.1 histidine kinase [Cyanobacteria bacterium UBA11153]HBW90196.1 histidine kinase [Cyanobacteria bacterium UBA11149]HCA95242.1 histidine kinase [Cyanobacteria bacterium UBA9226]